MARKKEFKSTHWLIIMKVWERIALVLYLIYMFGIPIVVFSLVYLLSKGIIKV
ncbi:MAG: hypothetical protein PVF58_21440 [Candidatus Methanofastidiosia archaeon]|jgi:hypothetical protein